MIVTRTIIIALEGPDGVGKSSHARALVETLKRRDLAAELFAHPQPPHGPISTVDRALWYRDERILLGARLAASSRPRVVIADRWWHSSSAIATTMDDGGALARRVEGEADAWTARGYPEVHAILLDAHEAVLEARIAKRGLTATCDDLHPARDRVRAWYRDAAAEHRWPTVRTDEMPARVASDLVNRVTLLLINLGAVSLGLASEAIGFDANGSPSP